MTTSERDEPEPRETLPLSVALLPAAAFGGIAYLSEAWWPGVEREGWGYLVLSAAVLMPLLVLCARARSTASRWAAVLVCAAASAAIALHAGLADLLVRDLDWRRWPTAGTVDAALGVILSCAALPAGLLVAERLRPRALAGWILVSAAAGAAGQLAWFTLTRIISGPGGIELWMWARVLIAGGVGAVAGLLLGSIRLHGLGERMADSFGVTDLAVRRLPAALPLALLLAAAATFSGGARVLTEQAEDDRFVTDRLDDYMIALSNRRLARAAGMDYPQLQVDLSAARAAVLGAARSDPDLGPLLVAMLDAMAREDSGQRASEAFDRAVLAVDRRMMETGVPYFLEPHELSEGGAAFRFALRYAVAGRGTLPTAAGGVALLRLRRDDALMVDTPYTGLSYPGIGTVLMDHIDESALKVHGRMLTAGVREDVEADGRLAWTRARTRIDKRGALISALGRRGHTDGRALERMAQIGDRWLHRVDAENARAVMDPAVLAAYDALADELAGHTELHEARHALDGDLEIRLPQLDELAAGPLSGNAVAEIRAHLTEVVEGPLGPRFAVASVMEHLAGENARANAYFFAAIVILEGLWGQPVRKPDTATEDGPAGPVERELPIAAGSPGWLSFSRIDSCCRELAALSDEELIARAEALWRRLFAEPYPTIILHPRGPIRYTLVAILID